MLKRIFGFIGQFLGDQWRQFTPTGQLLFVCGLVAIVVDAGIAYEYGITMSGLHAAGFALVALGLALFPDQVWLAAERRDWWTATILGAITGFALLPVAYQTHVGYGAGIRLGDMQQTGFQHTKLEGAKNVLGNSRASLATFRTQEKILIEEREQIKAGNPWVTATTADALRAEAKVLDERIAAEIAGKRGRAAGCKKVCEQLQDEKKGVIGKIASIERLEGVTARLAELEASIKATQRVIDDKTAAVANTGYRSSTVVNQNDALGSLWKLFTGKEAQPDVVSLATTGSASLAFLLMAPAFILAAGRNRKPEFSGKANTPTPVSEQSGNRTSAPARAYPSQEPTVTLARRTNGDINRAKLQAMLANMPSRLEARAA